MCGDEAGGVLVHLIAQSTFKGLYHEHLSCVRCGLADGYYFKSRTTVVDVGIQALMIVKI